MVFVKQALLDEEQRRRKSGNDSGPAETRGDDTALKAGRESFGKDENLVIVTTVERVVILLEIVDYNL